LRLGGINPNAEKIVFPQRRKDAKFGSLLKEVLSVKNLKTLRLSALAGKTPTPKKNFPCVRGAIN
jgi:hypothetical protein